MAKHPSPSPHRNQILSSLSASDLGLLEPHLASIAMKVRHVCEEPNKPIKHVYFMEEGITSVVAITKKGKKIEIGIGSEGVTGFPVIMGNHRSPNSTFVQIAGSAQRIAVTDLREAMDKSESLRRSLLKFAQSFMIQTAHTAVANGSATLAERLARWLLMAHDRVEGDDLPLTHEFLSLMLGVRRAGVTTALQDLESKALIRSRRGLIRILDRDGIEEIAGSFYGIPESEWQRLMDGEEAGSSTAATTQTDGGPSAAKRGSGARRGPSRR
jgi:CRP-like cAMP-binding protein